MYVVAHFLAPILPDGAKVMAERLGTPLVKICKLKSAFDNLVPGTTVATKTSNPKLQSFKLHAPHPLSPRP
jgi:hypothetical protein